MIDYKNHIMKMENARYRSNTHYDGKTGIAIGYGLDILQNSIFTINKFLLLGGLPALTPSQVALINRASISKVLFRVLQPNLDSNQAHKSC